jgi:hypothetical protein
MKLKNKMFKLLDNIPYKYVNVKDKLLITLHKLNIKPDYEYYEQLNFINCQAIYENFGLEFLDKILTKYRDDDDKISFYGLVNNHILPLSFWEKHIKYLSKSNLQYICSNQNLTVDFFKSNIIDIYPNILKDSVLFSRDSKLSDDMIEYLIDIGFKDVFEFSSLRKDIVYKNRDKIIKLMNKEYFNFWYNYPRENEAVDENFISENFDKFDSKFIENISSKNMSLEFLKKHFQKLNKENLVKTAKNLYIVEAINDIYNQYGDLT